MNVERSKQGDDLKRLGFRAFFYVIYSSFVWFGVAEVGRFFFAERVETAGLRAVCSAFLVVAISSVLGGLTSFGASFYWRRKSCVGLEELFCGIVGRTGVPTVALLGVVAVCEPAIERCVLTSAIVGYFLTAPVAFALTFPAQK